MTWGRIWRACRPWRLATLADFWWAAQWLEEQHRQGHRDQALRIYLSHVTTIAHEGVKRYLRCLWWLDQYTGGILSDPQTVQRLNLHWAEGSTLLTHFDRIGLELREWLDQLASGPADRAIAEWERRLDNAEEYRAFMSRLIHQFGNFEVIAMAMPGTGPTVTDRRVQTVLAEMFAIKRRLIRLFELAYSVRKAWRAKPPASSLGFFNPQTDLGRMVRSMIVEYMVQADPQRVAEARKQARQAGRTFVPYRFWRPAEALRQLAQVEYEDGPIRRPTPMRPYVDLRIGPVPPVCADATRLEWAIKELFNNAIAATATVSLTDHGLVAKPLRDSTDGRFRPAITLTVSVVRRRRWWRNRQGVRLVIADVGVGIDRDVLRMVPLWAFSTQRDWVDEEPERIIAAARVESRALMIGGKGIGLAFAQATIRELGGHLTVESTLGRGTQVIVDLPVPTLSCPKPKPGG
jgi:hypothetical protein